MRKFLLLVLLVCPGWVGATVKEMKVSYALTNKIISMSAVNTLGQYTGRSLRLTVTSLKKERDSLNLIVDIGMIMKPVDAGYQPMVLPGEDTLLLEPGKSAELDVYVFCGNSPRSCPAKDLHYSFARVGSDTLIKVLRFIKDKKLFGYLGQDAVWVITNGHNIGGVYDRDNDALSKALIKVLCAATGKRPPTYYAVTAHIETPGATAYVPRTTGIITEFDVTLRASAVLSVGVFNIAGDFIEKPVDRKMYAAGTHTIRAEFDPETYGPGNYFVRLMNPEGTLQEKKVEARE